MYNIPQKKTAPQGKLSIRTMVLLHTLRMLSKEGLTYEYKSWVNGGKPTPPRDYQPQPVL